jgi:hypothetical protein
VRDRTARAPEMSWVVGIGEDRAPDLGR